MADPEIGSFLEADSALAGLEQSMVLLGAGASADAGVPTSFEMTRRIGDVIAENRFRYPQAVSAFNFVCGALIAYDAASGASPFVGLDVERVFAAVELLAERRELEVTPFVAAWDPAVDSWDQRPPRPPAFVGKNLVDAISGPAAAAGPLQRGSLSRGHDIERLLTQLIDSRLGTVSTGATYQELATMMLYALRTLVAATPKVVQYLEPLVTSAQRPGGLTIATLNYDRSIELAADAKGVPLTTGIEQWIKTGSWTWPTEGIRLLKLHGSIDWEWRNQHQEASLPRRVVEVRAEPERAGDPALIFDQRAKLRAEGPFLGLLAEFERELSNASRLVVIGYSFRDDHVNEILRRWIAEDRGRTFLVIDPGWPDDQRLFSQEAPDFRTELRRFLIPSSIPGQPPKFSPRLEIWRKRCKEALPELCGAGVPQATTNLGSREQ